MNISRSKLLDLARDELYQREGDADLLSGFAIGSVVRGTAFLGGTADIDLVLIHRDDLQRPREYIRLSHQVHLDIIHCSQSYFRKPRELRTDPWMGPAIAEPGFLYDPEHFFERIQASVRGQFHRPDYALQRAHGFLELSRHHQSLMELSKRWQQHYLLAICCGANALLTCFEGPVAGRAWLVNLREHCQNLDEMDTYHGILQLCGLPDSTQWDLINFLPVFISDWEEAGTRVTNPRFSRCRKEYYLGGIRGLLDRNEHHAAAWLLLTSWETIIGDHENGRPSSQTKNDWPALLSAAKLTDADKLQRKDILARFLAHIAERVIVWGNQSGA
ncbi:MAG: hypothetical protein JXA97_01945 [Anaerolineales bacterium]|nr:hypothetical protein [Anaerolineales bacterium]